MHGTAEWRWRLGRLMASRAALPVALAMVAGYAVVAASGGPDQHASWYLTLGLRRAAVMEGSWWQVLTHALLHGSWPHVIANSALLWIVGSRVEQMAGARAFFKALLWSVPGGAAAHLALASPEVASSVLVGVSGGAMGLLLVLTTLSPDSRMAPLPVSARNLGVGVLLAEAMFVLIDPGLGVPVLHHVGALLQHLGWDGAFQIGHACHLGGGLAGWWFARRLLHPRVTLATLRADRVRREGPPQQ